MLLKRHVYWKWWWCLRRPGVQRVGMRGPAQLLSHLEQHPPGPGHWALLRLAPHARALATDSEQLHYTYDAAEETAKYTRQP